MHDECEENKDCHCHEHEHEGIDKNELLLTILGVISYIIAVICYKKQVLDLTFNIVIYVISYILIGYEILLNAVKKLFKKDMFDENFLMSIATIGALVIGEYTEAVAVLLLYKIGEFLQDLASDRAKDKIRSAIDLRPDFANIYINGKEEKVNPSDVNIGDVIIVKTGEKIPLDGIVIKGSTHVDSSALTGESKPLKIDVDGEVLSGSINIGSVIEIKVTKNYKNSTVYKMVEMINNATKNKSNTEKFITKFAKIYTPIVTIFAIVIFVLFPQILNISYSESASRALKFLVVSCPCALVISIPLGFFVGVGVCSKNNILVKGTNYLDIIPQVKSILFDKTGTLTNGKFEIVKKNICIENVDEKPFLEYIAYAESFSNHYLAKAILNSLNITIDKNRIKNHRELSGKGIRVSLDNDIVIVGNDKIMKENNIDFVNQEEVGSVIHLAVNNKYYGNIILEDTIKQGSKSVLASLKKYGIKKTYLLTGDSRKVASKVKEILGIDEVYSNLLPKEKQEMVKEISKKDGCKVAFVGDGINDGPVIALSDVGIAMGNGSDLAVESADVVILNNDIGKIIDLIKISKRTKSIVTQNITLILIDKIAFLILSGLGISSMWEAVFADVGISLISIINSLRIVRYKNKI